MSIAKRTLREDAIPPCRLARVNILNPIVNGTKLPALPIEEAKSGHENMSPFLTEDHDVEHCENVNSEEGELKDEEQWSHHYTP
ncbi:hypothetical protein OIDMADRAFT_19666 [Oidiodendron maius Zn]|uniref:Uncharacterized protein n=1 Tax=Oidiodendron maius (strain Zn) TaxID=913774 RepID=A0A0C3DC58_OIDMZ|nr:hypothetical protein OIDMADRAFT_19666 [Oidiodendron maius Zn]